MPRPPILPDSGTLKGHVADKWSYKRIADHYGVTVGAVFLQLKEIPGVVTPRPDYSSVIPWTVAVVHRNDRNVEALRHLGRRQQGRDLLPAKERALDKWLAARDADGTVVDYDREAGFRLVPRIPEDGNGYVRHPDPQPKAVRVQFMEP